MVALSLYNHPELRRRSAAHYSLANRRYLFSGMRLVLAAE